MDMVRICDLKLRDVFRLNGSVFVVKRVNNKKMIIGRVSTSKTKRTRTFKHDAVSHKYDIGRRSQQWVELIHRKTSDPVIPG